MAAGGAALLNHPAEYKSANEEVFEVFFPIACGAFGIAAVLLVGMVVLQAVKPSPPPPQSPSPPPPPPPPPPTQPKPLEDAAVQAEEELPPPEVVVEAGVEVKAADEVSTCDATQLISDVGTPVVTPPEEGLGVEGGGGGGMAGYTFPPPSDEVLVGSVALGASASCGFCLQINDKNIAELYGVSKFTSKYTCYCHHFDKEGKHCVLEGVSSLEARRCEGIMFAGKSSAALNVFGVGSLSLQCKPRASSHTACTHGLCPFVTEGIKCPYSV